jgi:hypothetical protein
MGQSIKDTNNTDDKDRAAGHDLPDTDGTVSDEDMKKVSGEADDKPTGQDHSLDNYADTMPDEGVGAVQDGSIIKDGVAHIEEE